MIKVKGLSPSPSEVEGRTNQTIVVVVKKAKVNKALATLGLVLNNQFSIIVANNE